MVSLTPIILSLHLSSSWIINPLLPFGLGLELEQYQQLSWVSNLLTVDLGLLILHNHVSQFLILKNLLYIYLYISRCI